MISYLIPGMSGDDAVDIREELDILADLAAGNDSQVEAGYRLGLRLGDALATTLGENSGTVGVGFGVEVADGVGRGVLESLLEQHRTVGVACLWTLRTMPFGLEWLENAFVVQEYVEPAFREATVLLVVLPYLEDGFVPRVNLSRLLEISGPDRVFIAAAVASPTASRLVEPWIRNSMDDDPVIPGVVGG